MGTPLNTLGQAAAELQLKKRTHIGFCLFLNTKFWFHEWICNFTGMRLKHLKGRQKVNTSTSTVVLKSDGNEVHWEPGKPLSCYGPLLFVSMFSTMHIFYLLNTQYIMSTLDIFLFRFPWDVHKMNALPSWIWTYSAVSGFWIGQSHFPFLFSVKV
ncbi:hypothetical protein KY289_018278 [Solanum tuberosum]|nr:hypothetical protein KY289_018278 [Solanum tuberosum]